MNPDNQIPNEKLASSIASKMTGEQILSATRLATGEQNFVYAVCTSASEYVLRMTDVSCRHRFQAAIKWQELLLPLGVPVAEFIQTDLDGKYSQCPALLMRRLPGDDLINVYSTLSDVDKKNIAIEMVSIQALCANLPEGSGFGISDSYDVAPTDKSWHEFLLKRLEIYKRHIIQNAAFDPDLVMRAIRVANEMEESFRCVRPKPFLWDASERNVLIHEGKITGIVDVDELCFGDPLLVIALTSTCLELDNYDTRYTDYWAAALHLDKIAQARLDFYRLFYAVAFMRKHAMQTVNGKVVMYDTAKLTKMFHESIIRLGADV